jgi:taurine dioxygenase
LNRAGVLRALEITPELLKKIEGKNIIHTLVLAYERARFGMPKNFRELKTPGGLAETVAAAKELPRAIHPAVWTRKTGEKVLHLSPWGAVGIEGMENAEGDALYDEVVRAFEAKVQPYFHKWTPDDMVIWDNWRMMHAVSGNDPKHPRFMHRTTIKGDYGLGYFEGGAKGRHAALEMTV